ncbi:hypothetical protein M2326_003237 [Flavobacterium sp. 7A]|nr:hypothetical protein [Flavobacterium sp. 7A]
MNCYGLITINLCVINSKACYFVVNKINLEDSQLKIILWKLIIGEPSSFKMSGLMLDYCLKEKQNDLLIISIETKGSKFYLVNYILLKNK